MSTPAAAAVGAGAVKEPRRPGTLTLIARQIGYEQKQYWRNRRRFFFSFAMPIMFLVIFSALYGNDPVKGEHGRRMLTFFVPGILAYGAIMTTFTSSTAAFAVLRHQGVLKRVRGTPIPIAVYLAGYMGNVVISTLVISVLMLGIGDVAYGVAIPWHAVPGMLAVLIVASASLTALGIGVVRLVKSPDSAPMIVNLLVLPLTFISGVWGQPVDDHTLQTIAGLFPVRMVADALQHAYDPSVHGAAIRVEDLWGLAIWGVVGVRLAQRFFRAEAANG